MQKHLEENGETSGEFERDQRTCHRVGGGKLECFIGPIRSEIEYSVFLSLDKRGSGLVGKCSIGCLTVGEKEEKRKDKRSHLKRIKRGLCSGTGVEGLEIVGGRQRRIQDFK
ncbi:hypothetical protein HAX54_021602 [Datura stramonium]|uniref:Uncharacterized protein n=1 Tax=Datura stramonium TaxID=4076 RepID=A0ABS8UTT8_DATST|nr:hypothetical protein [Datura stramonium]